MVQNALAKVLMLAGYHTLRSTRPRVTVSKLSRPPQPFLLSFPIKGFILTFVLLLYFHNLGRYPRVLLIWHKDELPRHLN